MWQILLLTLWFCSLVVFGVMVLGTSRSLCIYWPFCPGRSWGARWACVFPAVLKKFGWEIWVCTGLVVPPSCSLVCQTPCEHERQQWQHLKQHMLSLRPSAAERDGEKEGLECEALLSALFCESVYIYHVNDSLSEPELPFGEDMLRWPVIGGDCTKELRFEQWCGGQGGCSGIGDSLGENKVLWKLRKGEEKDFWWDLSPAVIN